MKTIFKDKSLYDYPHLIAILIVLLFGRVLGIGTGAVVAAWYCKCMSKQYSWLNSKHGRGAEEVKESSH
jgi:hypothetical protein